MNFIKKYGVLSVIVILILVSGFLIWKKLNPKKLPPYLVEAVGRVDGDLINLNTKYPGRVIKITVDTGDKVKKGEVVAVLDSKELKDKLKALSDEINAKKAQLKYAVAKIKHGISEAKAALNIAEEKVKAVNADISALKKVIAQDKKDEKRLAYLAKKNLTQRHSYEMAVLKTKTDEDKLKALNAKKEALINAYEIAKNRYETALASKHQITALRKEISALNAKKEALSGVISDLTIKSPINGFVDTKVANLGEVLGAGMPVALLIDPKSYYVKIYVDEITDGKIKVGQKAEIFLDSFPNKPIPAVVSKIAKRAEFTPKEVATRSDRITRVYEVRLKPLKPNPYLKLGLSATGVILIGNGSLPKSLNQLPPL